MIDLQNLSRRWRLPCDGRGIQIGLARVTCLDASDELAVNTSDPATAKTLYEVGIGRVLYDDRRSGAITLAFNPRALGQIVSAIEGATRS